MVLLIIGLILFVGLVVLHELGHFWVAKRNGVEVEEFGIFFPPTLWRKKMKGGWDFTINAIPLGGFVKLKGEFDADRRKGSFGAASFLAKAKIMLAGVFVNLVTAVVLFTVLALVGMPHIINDQFVIGSDARYLSRSESVVGIGEVVKNSPADKAGLKTGDQILAIGLASDDTLEKVTVPDELIALTKKYSGQEVRLEVRHDKKNTELKTRLHSEAEIAEAQKKGKQIGRLGAGLAEAREGVTVVRSTWSAPVVALGTTAQFTKLSFEGLGKALKGLVGIFAGALTGDKTARQNAQTEASSQVGGPLAIFFTMKYFAQYGLGFILFIVALISLTLAIMNVLPIPGLDGGKLFVMGAYRLLGKELTQKAEERIYTVGFLLLISLIIVITIVDVRRFF